MGQTAKQLPPALAATTESLKQTRAKAREQYEAFKASIRNPNAPLPEEGAARDDAAAKKAEDAYGGKGAYWIQD